MTDQVASINEAIEAARKAASEVVNTAVTPAAPTAVATAAPTRPVSMREMVQETGVRADAYLKVTPAGFQIGKDIKTYLDEIPVEFKLSSAKPFYGLRYGNPARYERSYDRQYNAKTKQPWADTVAMGTRLDPRCTGDYPAIDLAFTVLEDIKAKDGSVLLAAGKTLLWTSSITNWAEWSSFVEPIYTLQDAGVIPGDPLMRGKIVHAQKSKDSNTWGAVTLQCDVAAEVAQAA